MTQQHPIDYIHADVMQWARTYTGPKYHALISDPPYHLTEITNRFGKANSKPPKFGTDGAFTRQARGFMGKTWDGGDIAFRAETWAAFAQHMHPGAILAACSGSRGWHRMANAIEGRTGMPLPMFHELSDALDLALETRSWEIVDIVKCELERQAARIEALEAAGFDMLESIFGWTYTSGFPKGTKLDTAIDRRAGATRQAIAVKKHAPKYAAAEFGYREKDNGFNSRERQTYSVTAPATELARVWQPYRYGLQTLKPALEPIIVARRKGAKGQLDDILATGAGAYWIEGSRVGTDRLAAQRAGQARIGTFERHDMVTPDRVGRWPANLILIHHPACDSDGCHEDCSVLRYGQQSGTRAAGNPISADAPSDPTRGIYHERRRTASAGHGDTGTAARCFHQLGWELDMLEALEHADNAFYTPKPHSSEREAGLDPVQRAWMAQHYAGDDPEDEEAADLERRTINDGRKKSIDNAYQRGETDRYNIHPTIKPLTLARHLATLLLPPAEYAPRRLLVPFAGTGSEAIGAMLAGWDEITAIEGDVEHMPIGQARMRYWHQQRDRFNRGQQIKVRISRPKKAKAGAPVQESLI